MASTRFLTWIAILIGVLTPVVYLLEQNLESFYIFDKDHLHDLAKRGIAAHGNDTQGIVSYITTELHEKHPNNVNLDVEYIFNNAGGAMGAMYIIHASKFFLLLFFSSPPGLCVLSYMTKHFRMLNKLSTELRKQYHVDTFRCLPSDSRAHKQFFLLAASHSCQYLVFAISPSQLT